MDRESLEKRKEYLEKFKVKLTKKALPPKNTVFTIRIFSIAGIIVFADLLLFGFIKGIFDTYIRVFLGLGLAFCITTLASTKMLAPSKKRADKYINFYKTTVKELFIVNYQLENNTDEYNEDEINAKVELDTKAFYEYVSTGVKEEKKPIDNPYHENAIEEEYSRGENNPIDTFMKKENKK